MLYLLDLVNSFYRSIGVWSFAQTYFRNIFGDGLLMIPSVQSEFLFIVYLISVIKQYLTIVLVVFVFEFRNFLLGRVIFSKLTQIKRIVLHWQVLIQGSYIIVDDVNNLVLKCLDHRFYFINSFCKHFSFSTGLLIANRNLLGLFKSVIDLLNSVESFALVFLVCLVSENSLLHFMWV